MADIIYQGPESATDALIVSKLPVRATAYSRESKTYKYKTDSGTVESIPCISYLEGGGTNQNPMENFRILWDGASTTLKNALNELLSLIGGGSSQVDNLYVVRNQDDLINAWTTIPVSSVGPDGYHQKFIYFATGTINMSAPYTFTELLSDGSKQAVTFLAGGSAVGLTDLTVQNDPHGVYFFGQRPTFQGSSTSSRLILKSLVPYIQFVNVTFGNHAFAYFLGLGCDNTIQFTAGTNKGRVEYEKAYGVSSDDATRISRTRWYSQNLNAGPISDVSDTAEVDLSIDANGILSALLRDGSIQISRLASSAFNTTDGIVRLVGGLIPQSFLPAYVDDVLEFASLANFPATGETGKIYVALNTNITYRWSGSVYVTIGDGTATGTAGGDLAGSYPNPTIAAGAVTNSKMANMNAYTVKGNSGTAAAAPSDITASAASRVLARPASGGLAFVQITTAMIASNAITSALIADANVTNAKLASMGAYSVKMNNTNGPASPGDFTINANSILGRRAGGIENFNINTDPLFVKTATTISNVTALDALIPNDYSDGITQQNVSFVGTPTNGWPSYYGTIYTYKSTERIYQIFVPKNSKTSKFYRGYDFTTADGSTTGGWGGWIDTLSNGLYIVTSEATFITALAAPEPEKTLLWHWVSQWQPPANATYTVRNDCLIIQGGIDIQLQGNLTFQRDTGGAATARLMWQNHVKISAGAFTVTCGANMEMWMTALKTTNGVMTSGTWRVCGTHHEGYGDDHNFKFLTDPARHTSGSMTRQSWSIPKLGFQMFDDMDDGIDWNDPGSSNNGKALVWNEATNKWTLSTVGGGGSGETGARSYVFGRYQQISFANEMGVGVPMPPPGDGTQAFPKGFQPIRLVKPMKSFMIYGNHVISNSPTTITIRLRWSPAGVVPLVTGGTLLATTSFTSVENSGNEFYLQGSIGSTVPEGSYVWLQISSNNGNAGTWVFGSLETLTT